MLNDRHLTYIPSDIAHLLYDRRITSLPHPMVKEEEVIDPVYGNDESDLRKRCTDTQAFLEMMETRVPNITPGIS